MAQTAKAQRPVRSRDYSLLGTDSDRAVEIGLVTEDWYRTPIPRQLMKQLMKRSDQAATRDTALLFALMLVFSAFAVALMPSWWALPFWLAYGVLYSSAMDSRWHECGHGTAFKTRWKNRALYQVACFCLIRDPHCWKFSHARHHSDTVIVGRDPEVAVMRPVIAFKLFANIFGVMDVLDGCRRMFAHAAGRMLPDEKTYVDKTFYQQTIRTARIWLAIYVLVIGAAVLFSSWVPVLLIGLPRFFGSWHMVICGWLQHGGLADNVIDHRLNSRTVYMNPVSRYIYWNMNYHVEHHMFPLVPYYRLPELHIACADDFPAPNRSMRSAMAEMLPALWRQRSNPDYHLRRPLPASANPYRDVPLTSDAA